MQIRSLGTTPASPHHLVCSSGWNNRERESEGGSFSIPSKDRGRSLNLGHSSDRDKTPLTPTSNQEYDSEQDLFNRPALDCDRHRSRSRMRSYSSHSPSTTRHPDNRRNSPTAPPLLSASASSSARKRGASRSLTPPPANKQRKTPRVAEWYNGVPPIGSSTKARDYTDVVY